MVIFSVGSLIEKFLYRQVSFLNFQFQAEMNHRTFEPSGFLLFVFFSQPFACFNLKGRDITSLDVAATRHLHVEYKERNDSPLAISINYLEKVLETIDCWHMAAPLLPARCLPVAWMAASEVVAATSLLVSVRLSPKQAK